MTGITRDLTNQRFGKLVVIKKADTTGREKWICHCDCGNVKAIDRYNLLKGYTKSCGCVNSPDLTGQRFFKMVVQKRTTRKNSSGEYYWECLCDCGNLTYITSSNLKSGTTKSCGCYSKEMHVDVALGMVESRKKHKVEGVYVPALLSKVNTRNTSGYKGVSYHTKRKQWRARIKIKGKEYNLGWFKDKEDAIKARQRAEEELLAPIIEKFEKQKKQ
jgi:hypothetical protein